MNESPDAAAVSPSDRLADRLAAARRMQQQQLQAVAGNSTKPAASAACDDAATIAVTVKVLTKPQHLRRKLLYLQGLDRISLL